MLFRARDWNADAVGRRWVVTLASVLILGAAPAWATEIHGRVLGGGVLIANSTVTLWSATTNDPTQVAQTMTGPDGTFELRGGANPSDAGAALYLVAKGGRSSASPVANNNPAIALIAVLGSRPPTEVTINEFTTIASVVTHNQFIDGRGGPAC